MATANNERKGQDNDDDDTFSDIKERFRRGEIDKYEMEIEKWKRLIKYQFLMSNIPPYYQRIIDRLERKSCPNCGKVNISERWLARGESLSAVCYECYLRASS